MNPIFLAFIAPLTLAIITWAVSVPKKDVSIVDGVWSWLIASTGVVFCLLEGADSMRALVVMTLLLVWALRLSVHIFMRAWGEEEDHRYQKIRARNAPNFALKSVYLVFGLQAVLAWVVSLVLWPSMTVDAPWHWLDTLALLVVLTGMFFEFVGDWQLTAFKRERSNDKAVLNTGLWRYTRHPNYFGEFVIWWGMFLFTLPVGGYWTIVSPLLMSVLLMRVSGVTLLESDITERRPEYADYIQRTNAFFPWFPKPGKTKR